MALPSRGSRSSDVAKAPRHRAALSWLAVLACALTVPLGAPRNTPLPTPGTAQQVAALVAASGKIEQLPSDLVPNLFQVVNDNTGAYYPVTQQGCAGLTKCVFGDTKATATVVMFGDSHAYMWLPALVPLAKAKRFRLVLVWTPSCPAASVSVWDPTTHSINTSCNTFRSKTLKAIGKLAPELVLVASRTTQVYGANGAPISDAVWKAGLEKTIDAIAKKPTKVAVIGDITQFSVILPDCLAAEPKHVQSCASPDPNPKIPGHYKAEMEAATATHTHYLNPQPWLCTTTCSPIIGKYVGYYNNNHVTATYAEYLSTVFGAAVSPLLPRSS